MKHERYALTAVLGTLLTGAAAVVAWETDFGRALFAVDITPPERRATLDTNVYPPFQLGGMESTYRETVERPLFVPTRKPAPPALPTTQVVMRKGQFRLAGTLVNNNASYAFLYETAATKTHRIAVGSQVNGIQVQSVTPTLVVLKQGDDTEELRLVTSASPRVPQAPSGPLPPGMQPPGQPSGNVGAPPSMPNMPQPVTAGGMPVPAAQAASAPPGTGAPQANNATQDPNSPMVRRRRFQNLPQ